MAQPGSVGPWEWRTLGGADPGSGGSWEWRTLGVADLNPHKAQRSCIIESTITIILLWGDGNCEGRVKDVGGMYTVVGRCGPEVTSPNRFPFL